MLEKIKEIVADQLGIDEDDIKLESKYFYFSFFI